MSKIPENQRGPAAGPRHGAPDASGLHGLGGEEKKEEKAVPMVISPTAETGGAGAEGMPELEDYEDTAAPSGQEGKEAKAEPEISPLQMQQWLFNNFERAKREMDRIERRRREDAEAEAKAAADEAAAEAEDARLAAELEAKRAAAEQKRQRDEKLEAGRRAMTITPGELKRSAEIAEWVSSFEQELKDWNLDDPIEFGRVAVAQSAIPAVPKSGLPLLQKRRKNVAGEASALALSIIADCVKFRGLAAEVATLNQKEPMYQFKLLQVEEAEAERKAGVEKAAAERKQREIDAADNERRYNEALASVAVNAPQASVSLKRKCQFDSEQLAKRRRLANPS